MIYFDTPFGYVRDMLLKPLALVIYALLVGAAVAWSKKPERFVIPMLISVFVMAGMAIIFVATSGASLSSLAGEYSRHFLSTLGLHANDLGRLYAVAFALLLFVWDRTRRIGLKTLLVISMVTVVVALLLTFSRGAFFGFVIVCALYLVLRRSMKTFAIAALVVPFAIMFMPGAFWYRLQMGFDSGLNEITAGRYEEIWLPLIPEVLRTMPWGGGLGSVMWAKAMLLGEMFAVGHPHNAYIQLYMDLGIVGTVLVLMFWLQSLRGFWKLGRDERLIPEMQGFFEGAAVGLVSFLVAGIAGSSLEPSPEQGYLWLALGMMWGVRKHLAKIPKAVKAPKPSRSTNLTPYPLGAGEI
jgi:O-antigen ligase